MLYKSDTTMLIILYNIFEHLKRDYDFILVICGDTGTGKSRFALNLLETWYRVILGKEVTPDMIDHISQNYAGWLTKFNNMQKYDMNIFDESSRDLSSLNFMSRVSKDINKLFEVFRCKRYFSVMILPSFFRLNKAIREDRIRGLVWVDKRGNYKFYTKKGLKYLNGYNENRRIKNMYAARPFHQKSFPDYDGILLDQYQKRKNEGVDEVLQEVIGGLENAKSKPKETLVDVYQKKVIEMKKSGLTQDEIVNQLSISKGTVNKCLISVFKEESKKSDAKS